MKWQMGEAEQDAETTLSYASVMGIKKDIKLVGDDYQWLGSMFYFGTSGTLTEQYMLLIVSRISSVGVPNKQIATIITSCQIFLFLHNHVGTRTMLHGVCKELPRGYCCAILPRRLRSCCNAWLCSIHFTGNVLSRRLRRFQSKENSGTPKKNKAPALESGSPSTAGPKSSVALSLTVSPKAPVFMVLQSPPGKLFS